MCSMQYYMYIYVYVAFLLQCRTLIPNAFCSAHLCATNDISFNFHSARKKRLKKEFYLNSLFGCSFCQKSFMVSVKRAP